MEAVCQPELKWFINNFNVNREEKVALWSPFAKQRCLQAILWQLKCHQREEGWECNSLFGEALWCSLVGMIIRGQTELDQVYCVCFVKLCRQVTVRYEMMNYKVIPVGAWWYWVIIVGTVWHLFLQGQYRNFMPAYIVLPMCYSLADRKQNIELF